MGTRNLTMVYSNGDYKVAQYGQWDGYPEGTGLTVLHFLRDKMNEQMFTRAVNNCSEIRKADLDRYWKEAGATDSDWVTMEASERFKKSHPELSRDTGAEVLELIQGHPEGMELKYDLDFAADSLFCEWAWLVDLDKRTFEAYKGFNQSPLTEEDRFFFLRDHEDHDFHGVKLVGSWPLDSLPSDDEFLDHFKTEEET